MTKNYEEIDSFERAGFTIIVDKTWEDISPRDCFDDECWDMKQMFEDIERGKLDWFMLRVRIMVDEYELASEFLGGCLYENVRDVLTDGTADDLISYAMITAKREVYRMYKKFQELSFAIDAEGVEA
jgi:hypothetical protein